LLPIFTQTASGEWELAPATLEKAKKLGCGMKTERGDLAAVIMTPEDGKFSQMMLGVTRSIGDFYHQSYGVTWRPEVVVKDLREECLKNSAAGAVLIVASDGVWDHWGFEDAMAELVLPSAGPPNAPLTNKKHVIDFFERTRYKGEETFGDGADNLTGIVALLPLPPPADSGGAAPQASTVVSANGGAFAGGDFGA